MKKWYGTAGKSMGTESFKKAFGNSGHSDAGKLGEQKCEKMLKSIAPMGSVGMSSLSLPESSGDIDFVLVRGRNVVLIDSKLWKAGHYTTKRGAIYRDGKVAYKKPSRNMTWARDQIQKRLGPGYKIHPVVILMSTGGKKPITASRLKFPGRVPGFASSRGMMYVRFKLGILPGSRARTKEAVDKLRNLVQ